MSGESLPKHKKNADFWRACRFLYPHRGIVIISVICAFFVGAAFTSGLSTMLPMLRVLINGDTVAGWVNRQVVEYRLGAKLFEEPTRVQVAGVKANTPAGEAGLTDGDIIIGVGAAGGGGAGDAKERANAEQSTSNSQYPTSNLEQAAEDAEKAKVAAAARLLAEMSSPEASILTVRREVGAPVTITLKPVPWYWIQARQIASHLPTHPVAAIGVIFAVIAILAVIGNFFRFFQEYLSDKAAILSVNDIRRKLYDHVLHIPLNYFGQRGSSDVTSRLVQDSQGLENGFKTVLGQAIQEPIRAAMAFGLAMAASWRLTLFIVIFAPIMVTIIRKFGKKMRRANRKALQRSSAMLGQIEGTLIGIRVVKGANAERHERRRYTGIMDQLVSQQLRMSRIDAWSTPTMETLTLLVVGAVLLFASYLVLISHTLTVERFFLVMACLMGIGESLRRLGKVNNVLSKASAAAARIFELLDLPAERPRELGERVGSRRSAVGGEDLNEGDVALHKHVGSAPRADQSAPAPVAARHHRKLPPLAREIRFEGVSYTYPDAPSVAVDDVSLTIVKGQSVAIVGRNGSGKTTLMALLPRFYDPQRGRICIDDVDIRTATLKSLREQIAIVTQDSVIFPGTIADNIAYGRPNPVRERIITAAKRAFAHEFIMEKAEGYDTLLGEMGGQLSGGQKQRLCIARAIYRDSPILILDEATSQVDAESEHLIQQAVESLMRERTTFIIAHRFSTILSADSIVVMDRGKIVAQGQHADLLQTCETYQQLYERQLIAAPV